MTDGKVIALARMALLGNVDAAAAIAASEEAQAAAASVSSSAAQIATNKENIEALQTVIETKANIDGYYDSMTVGNAEQLISNDYATDSVPYNFRTAGGDADIGNREYDELVGGTLAWNQLASMTPTFWNYVRVSHKELSSGVLTMTVDTANGYSGLTKANFFKLGHKYYISCKLNVPYATDYRFGPQTGTTKLTGTISNTDTYVTISGLTEVSSAATGDDSFLLYIDASATGYESGSTYMLKELMVIDLTQMFGIAIADHIYALETNEAGAGVAWFKRLFPKDYYAYNAGTLMSVNAASHDMVGFNAYDNTTGIAHLVGGQQYQITGTYTAISYADVSGNAETLTPDASGIFTPTNSGTLTVTGGNSTDTCVHLVWSGYRNGEYEAYEKHSYPLDSDLTLQGIPKLDASNNLYYDGDTYAADGTVTRRYGVLTDQTGAIGDTITLTGLDTSVTDIVTSVGHLTDVGTLNGTTLTLTTALSGADIVYPLTTPTTETADPFQAPQVVSDFGTEQYIDYAESQGTRDVSIPVGHATKYIANLVDKLRRLPDAPDAAGNYLVHYDATTRRASYTAYIGPTELPDAPAEDGTYTLAVTVADGGATYSWEAQS